MSFWKTLVVFCVLLAIGVEYSHARPVYTRLDATVGSKVAIPCKARTDPLSGASSVKLEWGMTPEGGGLYTPLLYDDVNNLHKDYVDCGVVFDSIRYRDSGTYEGRFIVDNVPYQPFKVVIIHVTDPTSTETADTETFKKHQSNLETQLESPSDASTETANTKTVRKHQRNLETQWETPSDASSETVWDDHSNQETQWETPSDASSEIAWDNHSNQETQWETPSDTSPETADTETVREDQSNVEIQEETPSVTSTETAETVNEDQSNVEIQTETPSVTSTETADTETVSEDQSNVEIQRETPPVTSTEEVPMMSPTMTTTTENSTYNKALVLIDLCVKFITETFYQLKRNGYLPLVCILAGVGLLVVIIISIVGVCYCKKRRREGDILKTVVIEDRCTAKDEERIVMEQSGDMEGGITESNETQTQLTEVCTTTEKRHTSTEEVAAMEELSVTKQKLAELQEQLAKMQEILAETQGELSETKNELAVKENELTETKEILSGLQKEYLETLMGIEGGVTAMEEELTVTEEPSATKN